MQNVTITQIIDRLKQLPNDRLAQVYDFVSFLVAQESASDDDETSARQMMIAAEPVLRRDWDRPEEDAAWADL